ncbi:LOW QUALITY PROTEIN: hypothetical protein KUTeg_023296 [Tegillarca granosa]|uniref:MULE transposase domain-containing protein n=1 Tax=Tegillarca granosa TaxID=220873 RepID=A0ABQ9E492_TEGGR|nr:LOW QUALITY PROTEIN: hypothetical protein KUTeg_023296 [Tegillarca granosa]
MNRLKQQLENDSIYNASEAVFPGVSVKGRFFFIILNVFGGKHNSVDYKCHIVKMTKCKVRRAAVLPLIPSASVEDVWLNALESINEADIDINTTPFCDYVTEYWVENNRDIWNHFENEGPRTTNHLEGWHNKLKKQVRCAHPNIFNLLKLLN